MGGQTRSSLPGWAVLSGILALGLIFGASLSKARTPRGSTDDRPEPAGGRTPAPRRISVDDARDRAKLVHKIYAATLETIHHHYFRRDRAVLPARAMEDIFTEVAEESKIEARWIAINTKAMSIDHEPKTAFDRQVVDRLGSGKKEFERVEDGYLRRAEVIPLGSGCIGCHAGFGNATSTNSKTPRFAGLIISVPLNQD